MEDKKFLDDLGHWARKEDAAKRRRFDDRWRRLSAGTLSEEEDAVLRAQARESESVRLDYEAFRPLDQEFRDRLSGEWQSRARETPTLAAAHPQPRRRRKWARRRHWLPVAATLILSLGASLIWWQHEAKQPLLHAYQPEWKGHIQPTRSLDIGSTPPTFPQGGRFLLKLKPDQPIHRRVEHRFFLRKANGERQIWSPGYFNISTSGTVTIEGQVGKDLVVEPGAWNLETDYGWPGELPSRQTAGIDPRPTGDWIRQKIPFEVLSASAIANAIDPVGSRPLEVEYAGCYAMSRGPICTPYAKLKLWIRSLPDAEFEIRVGDRIVEAAGNEIDGGRLFHVEAPSGPSAIQVCTSLPGREECWGLALGPSTQPEWLKQAKRLASKGELDQARRLIEEHIETSEPVHKGSALSALARFLPSTDGEIVEKLSEAVTLHRDWSQLRELAKDTAMLVDYDFSQRDLGTVRERIATLSETLSEHAPAEAKFQLFYLRGMLMSEEGNYRAALLQLRRAIDLAERLDLSKGTLAKQVLAATLRRLGRYDDVLQLFDEFSEEIAPAPCDRAEFLTNYTWTLILSPIPQETDPVSLIEDALQLLERHDCSRNQLELDLHLNLALAHVNSPLPEPSETGEDPPIRKAQEALAEADALIADANSFHQLWRQDIAGRIDLYHGVGLEALDSYREMERLAAQAFFPEGEWRAKIGQAQAHQILEDLESAQEALVAAEGLLDEHHLDVPLDEGRAAFASQRETGAKLHLNLLLRLGRDDEALAVARRSRARVLRALRDGHRLAQLTPEEQQPWNQAIAKYHQLRAQIETATAEARGLSVTQESRERQRIAEWSQEARRLLDHAFSALRGSNSSLPPLREGELVLGYHPLPEGEWVGFAATRTKTESHRFTLPEGLTQKNAPDELSARLLEPFRQAIHDAERIRILPYGELITVDFHALPFAGDVLLAEGPVVYGLDLTPTAGEQTTSRRALVMPPAPLSGLLAAQAEAEAVADVLSSLPAPYNVHLLAMEHATPISVHSLLESGFDLMHFSGHGKFEGTYGWDSALDLGERNRLTLGDILALERAPRQVVLSSCETGQQSSEAPVASLGLAQAFLVAGAQSVVAAVRPVGDSDTAALFRDFYRAWDADTDLATELRRVQLLRRTQTTDSGWESFRVLEP